MNKIIILAGLMLCGIANSTLEAQNTVKNRAQTRIAVLCNQIKPPHILCSQTTSHDNAFNLDMLFKNSDNKELLIQHNAEKIVSCINKSNIIQFLDETRILERIIKYDTKAAFSISQLIDQEIISLLRERIKKYASGEFVDVWIKKRWLLPLLKADTRCIDILQKYFLIPLSVTENKNVTRFVEKYALPDQFRTLIEENTYLKAAILFKGWGTKKELPHLFLKGEDLTRLVNAERLRSYLQKYKLDCLDVARKYIHKVDGKLIVFAEYISRTDLGQLTLKEVQQLVQMSVETGFGDHNIGNWIRAKNSGKLVCVDTEDKSFTGTWNIRQLLLQISSCYTMTPEASKWLEEKYAFFEENPELDQQQCPSITMITEFDTDIDFQQVKFELNMFWIPSTYITITE